MSSEFLSLLSTTREEIFIFLPEICENLFHKNFLIVKFSKFMPQTFPEF